MKHVGYRERRKSRGYEGDEWPADQYVPWHEHLVIGDLAPGQWSIDRDGRLMKRVSETKIFESARSVIC